MDKIDRTINFPSPNIYLGKIFPGTKHNLIFEFLGPSNLIEDIVPSCGCTASMAIVDNSKITGVYHDNTALDLNTINRLPIVNKERLHEINKSIAVYLADGKPLKIQNERGFMIYNPEKLKIWLYLHGTVVFTEEFVKDLDKDLSKT